MKGHEETVINRRNPKPEGDNIQVVEPKNHLTLPEKVLVLALSNGRTSFWNDSLSLVLRGSILVELSFKGKIGLEKRSANNKFLLTRKVLVLDESLTGERVIDETLKNIKSLSADPMNVPMWLECLNGENWNPKNWKYQLRNVKERLAKDLVEKGVLSMRKASFVFFDTYTYPITDNSVKNDLARDICENLLQRWPGDPGRMDRNILALILMVYSADILEDVLSSFSDSDYGLVKSRLDKVTERTFEDISEKYPGNEVLWAVCEHLLK